MNKTKIYATVAIVCILIAIIVVLYLIFGKKINDNFADTSTNVIYDITTTSIQQSSSIDGINAFPINIQPNQNITYNLNENLPNELTIEILFKYINDGIIISLSNDYGYHTSFLEIIDNNLYTSVWPSLASGTYANLGVLEKNKWYYCLISISSNDKKIYYSLNGNLLSTMDIATPELPSRPTINIGKNDTTNIKNIIKKSTVDNNGFVGYVSNLRVYAGILNNVSNIIIDNFNITQRPTTTTTMSMPTMEPTTTTMSMPTMEPTTTTMSMPTMKPTTTTTSMPNMAPTTTTSMPTTTTSMPTTTMSMPTMEPTTTTMSMPTMEPTTTTMSMPTTALTNNTMSMPTTVSTNTSITETTKSSIPAISPSQTIALINSGVNLDTLTSQGISMSSAFRGPATNIVQTDFTGTSNIYSPYLYYNKGTNEKFSGYTKDKYSNIASY